MGISNTSIKTLADARNTLREIETSTGIKPAFIYAIFVPTTVGEKGKDNQQQITNNQQQITNNQLQKSNDQLELILITSQGKTIRHRTGVVRSQVVELAGTLRASTVTNFRRPNTYQSAAQQMYKWLVAPLESELQAQKINNLVFLMDASLRSIPIAALNDGTGPIVERYSVGLVPSLSLTDTRYVDVRNSSVLAMGAEKFADQNPLPAVPAELSGIVSQKWQGKSFLNETFTVDNLKSARSSQPFGIIHLATHAEFQTGKPSQSYIQFWNSKLRLDKLRELELNKPPVELLVLSACRTAFGDEEAELGFAGLAVQAGAKSSLGKSLVRQR